MAMTMKCAQAPVMVVSIAWMLCGFAGFPAAAHAAPVVDFPAGNAAWTVDISYPKAKGAAPAASATPAGSAGTPGAPATPVAGEQAPPQGADALPEKVVAARSGDRSCYIITYLDKTVSEVWIVGPHLVTEDPKTHSVNVLPADRFSGFGPYDGALFDWVKENMLVSNDAWKGKPAAVYRGTSGPVATPGYDRNPANAQPSQTLQVWVDPETRRPLALDDGTRVCTFTFQPGPARLPPFPQNLENALKLYASSFRTSPIPRGRSR